ncbi:MAG: hypothetical protein ACLFVB_05720 [Thermoplasmata archaeon]
MQVLYYGIEDEEGKVPGNILKNDEMVSSILVPVENMSELEKPGNIEIQEDDDLLKNSEEINPSDYLVKDWKNGKAKRIYSGMIGSLDDDWKEIEHIEVYGNGSVYVDGEQIKGKFTITYGSTVLIKDVQDVCERTDKEMEKEYYHCVFCDKKLKSYKAIEEMVPNNWMIGDSDEGKEKGSGNVERKEDGSTIIHGICPDCAEERDLEKKGSRITDWG